MVLIKRNSLAIRALLIFSALLFIALACPRTGLRPAQRIPLRSYVEMSVPHAGVAAPVFPAVLDVAPVESMELLTDYNPDGAFKGKFAVELREGAITYFDRKALFIAVRPEGGELSLKIHLLSYEASRRANPQKILLYVEAHLINTPKHEEILTGKTGASMTIPINELRKPINITPPGGGRGWVMERGAFELAQLCLVIYRNIEKQIIQNKDHILNTLK